MATVSGHVAPDGMFCHDCYMWVSSEQWDGHVAGKKHRKNTRVAKLRPFSSDQQYWARETARFHLHMLYARYLVLLQRAAG
eukprot:3263159-Lingulodinium_polyedra.AAC.1